LGVHYNEQATIERLGRFSQLLLDFLNGLSIQRGLILVTFKELMQRANHVLKRRQRLVEKDHVLDPTKRVVNKPALKGQQNWKRSLNTWIESIKLDEKTVKKSPSFLHQKCLLTWRIASSEPARAVATAALNWETASSCCSSIFWSQSSPKSSWDIFGGSLNLVGRPILHKTCSWMRVADTSIDVSVHRILWSHRIRWRSRNLSVIEWFCRKVSFSLYIVAALLIEKFVLTIRMRKSQGKI